MLRYLFDTGLCILKCEIRIENKRKTVNNFIDIDII